MKSIFLIVLCLGFISASAPVLSKNWVLEKTSIYSPFANALLTEYAKYPSSSVSKGGVTISSSMKPFEFIDFTSEKTILESISTSVHETMHAYNGFIPVLKREGVSSHHVKQEGFMLDVNRFKIISHVEAKLFPSSDLVTIIPESLKTFRFSTYIEGVPIYSSTQSSGIYGLLDEYLAYYSGSKVIFDLKPLFLEYYDSYYGFIRWSTEFSSNQGAFYEFDFFIKEYLLHAKKYHPQLYEQLKQDPDFRDVYQTIQLKFIELTKQYEKEYDQFVLAQKKNTSNGVSYSNPKFHESIYKVLQPQLQNVRYDVIEKDFGVK